MQDDILDEELDFEYTPEHADENAHSQSHSTESGDEKTQAANLSLGNLYENVFEGWLGSPNSIIWSDSWITASIKKKAEQQLIRSNDPIFFNRDISSSSKEDKPLKSDDEEAENYFVCVNVEQKPMLTQEPDDANKNNSSVRKCSQIKTESLNDFKADAKKWDLRDDYPDLSIIVNVAQDTAVKLDSKLKSYEQKPTTYKSDVRNENWGFSERGAAPSLKHEFGEANTLIKDTKSKNRSFIFYKDTEDFSITFPVDRDGH